MEIPFLSGWVQDPDYHVPIVMVVLASLLSLILWTVDGRRKGRYRNSEYDDYSSYDEHRHSDAGDDDGCDRDD